MNTFLNIIASESREFSEREERLDSFACAKINT